MTDGKATLEDGTIAGSATCLAECFRRAVSFGVPLDAALRAACLLYTSRVSIAGPSWSYCEKKEPDIFA